MPPTKIAKLPPVRPITAVSYSRLQTYAWCPQQLRYSVIMGIKEPPSEAMERGNDTHKMLERVVLAPGKKLARLPAEYAHLAPELTKIRRHAGVECEAQFAYDASWQPVEYFGKTVAWRMKIDLRYLLNDDNNDSGGVRLLDYKTGKVKPEEHTEQLELYALVELLRAPVQVVTKRGKRAEVRQFPSRVETAVWYVDHEPEPRILTVYEAPDEKTLARLKKTWDAKARPLVTDTQLTPTPSPGKCGRCFHSKWNHGTCQAAAKAKEA